MLSSKQIKQEFFKYFLNKQHKIYPSSPLISSDPTLLFTSAGMVQFKDIFLGLSAPQVKRIVSCQKCFRTTDIEKVGKTARHLTFFEMLGNFSFGDYFKEEAINFAWDFLTSCLKVPADNLYITVYYKDEESYNIWRKIVGEKKIYKLGEETNFWEIGVDAPCGPCSEIIWDRGKDKGCLKDCDPSCDCDRWMEIWNLVFTEFKKNKDGSLSPLPQKNIDTGMGLERLSCLVQDKESVFEIDCLAFLLKEIEKITGIEKNSSNQIIFKIIADHLRSISFLISEGILPSNEGRGYTLRHLIRRTVLMEDELGINPPFIYQLIPWVVDYYMDDYPQFKDKKPMISTVVKMEEEKFCITLKKGIEILEKVISTSKKIISGKDIFRLYDTYGFPLELTKEIVSEKNLTIDEQGFYQEMEKQKQIARKSWKSIPQDTTFYQQLSQKFGKTEFVGDNQNSVESEILWIDFSEQSPKEVSLIINTTPFYPEKGGQVCDKGEIIVIDEKSKIKGKIKIDNVFEPQEGLIIHQGEIIEGEANAGDRVKAVIDLSLRKDIQRHHSATHILQAVLRRILGNHIVQSGSLVNSEKLRFDFTHLKPLTLEEISLIEEEVNEVILANYKIETKIVPFSEAQKLGALAFFEEKYKENVRMVSILTPDQKVISRELCGGTHCNFTGEIGLFKIINESGVASGIRRIEAICGGRVLNYIKNLEERIFEISEMLKVAPLEIEKRIQNLIQTNRQLENEIKKLEEKLYGKEKQKIQEFKGVKYIISNVDIFSQSNLREISDKLQREIESGIIILTSVKEEKINIIVRITPDLVKKGYSANEIINQIAKIFAGTGGGRDDFAQGGGKITGFALNEIEKKLSAKIQEIIQEKENN